MEKVFEKAIATYGSEEIPDYIRIKKNLSNLTETPWECIRFPLPKTVEEAKELQMRFYEWLEDYEEVKVNTFHDVFTNPVIRNGKIISFGNDDFGEDRLPEDFESTFNTTYEIISSRGYENYLLHYYVVDAFAGFAVPDCIWYSEASPFLKKVLDFYMNAYKEVVKKEEKPVEVFYISPRKASGLTRKRFEFSLSEYTNLGIEEFNEDLPHNDVVNFLNSDKNGVLIFHGTPGCGKTSYIRYLMSECRKRCFNILSVGVLLGYIEDFKSELIRSSTEEQIFIVEDCEPLLKPRESGGGNGPILSDILNILDGILGNIAKCKFIFTFNTKLSEVDRAILRKGRCKLNYEFRPLQGERLKALAEANKIILSEEDLKDGMTLSDIFSPDDAKTNKTEKKKIGFC